MSDNDKKRKADESILEKIYSKLKKVDDHYYNLKKTIKASQWPQNGRSAESTRDNETDAEEDANPNASKLKEVMELLGLTESPNSESDKQKKSIADPDEIVTYDTDEDQEASIDEEVLEILGEDPSSLAPKSFHLHSNLASRWKAWITSGLDKEARVSLLKDYSREGNCPLDAPILNPELIASLNEAAVRRDKHFIDSQCLIGSAMSALGSAITLLLNEGNEGVDKNELLKLLCDSGKLMAELHHKESVARKAYILPGLDKKAKTVLGKVDTDKYLFGENLSEKLKSAKAVEKAGLEIKLQPAKTTSSRPPLKPSNSVNWKGPAVRFQRTQQTGNNRRGPYAYKSTRGRQYQENWHNPTSEQQHNQKPPDKSSKGKK